MNFSKALEAVKQQQVIARSGWNGKDMFVYLNPGSAESAGQLSHIDGVPSALFEQGAKGTVTRMPCLCLRTPTGSCVMGWLASQTDMLADDWAILGSLGSGEGAENDG